MNNAKMGEERDGKAINEAINSAHQYNLQPRPSTRNYIVHPCPNQQSAKHAQTTRAHNNDATKC